jgi:hypothetical protein
MGDLFLCVRLWTNYIVAYRPVGRQRPRNKQRVQQLLRNKSINKRPFLNNISVYMFSRKRTRTQQEKKVIFDVVRIEEL